MKKSRKSILYITIVVLIIVVIILIGTIINLLNSNKIEDNQKIIKKQLEEKSNNDAYITLEAHNLELKDKQQEIDNMKNTAGQATITADKILKDYTAYKDGKLITGTMVNRGALNWVPTTSTTYTVPAGYYSGGTLDSSVAYNAGMAAGKTSPNISKGTYTWEISSRTDKIGTLSYATGKSNLIACVVTNCSNLFFYSWQENYNAYTSGGVTTAVDSSGNIYVYFNGSPTNKINTTGGYRTCTITVDYYYY